MPVRRRRIVLASALLAAVSSAAAPPRDAGVAGRRNAPAGAGARTSPTSEPAGVAVRVGEPAGVARAAAPVMVGVPWPARRLRDAKGVWLAGDDGRPLPTQSTVLERWPDGSVRWLLVDALGDVPAHGERTWTVRTDAAPRAPRGPSLRVEPRGATVEIDTGAVALRIPGDDGALLGDVRAGDTRLAHGVPLPRLDAGRGAEPPTLAGAPVVEVRGPVRSQVLLRGRWASGVALEARVACVAGSPAVRLRLTLTAETPAAAVSLRRLALEVPGRWRRGALGLESGARRFEPLDAAHELIQPDAATASVDGKGAGGRAAGWVRVADDTAAVTLVAPRFWQQFPKAARVAPDGVALDLVGGGEPLALGRGAAITLEAWVVVEPAARAGEPDAEAAALSAPLVGVTAPRWTVASGALPQALDPDTPGARAFLGRLASAYTRYQTRAHTERWDDGPPVPCDERRSENPRTGYYGLLNWGDWNFPGYRDRMEGACDAWGNLEYDLPQVLALAWMATGERRYWDGFEDAVRHYRDVDVIHFDPEHPDRVGLNHPHKAGHFAIEAVKNVDLGHTWTEGLVTHWRLTGDVRSRDAAHGIADALARRLGKAANPRQYGWPMIALAAVAGSSNEARDRDAASRYAVAARGAFPPTPAAADWKIGILADGLAAVDAVAPDPATRAWLVTYADAFLAGRDRFADARYALPLGWLARATGQARYADAARAVAASLSVGDWGKTLALGGRTGFRLLGPLAGMPAGAGSPPPAVTPPGRAVPPPASAPARRRSSPSRAAPAPRSDR